MKDAGDVSVVTDLLDRLSLGSPSIVILSVKQRLLKIGPEVTMRPLATSWAEDYKGPSLVQTSFSEPPSSPWTPTHQERRCQRAAYERTGSTT